MPEATSTAAAISGEAAFLAGALGDLLGGLDAEPALADSVRFLGQMSQATAYDAPAVTLDRLAVALDLSATERAAVVLAGLPEEHEGYAGVLRELHPKGSPRPTTGLAARLLCGDPDERADLRAALASGPAAGAGLLRVDSDGPWPERSLSLPPELWTELSGRRPALAGEMTARAVTAGLGRWLATGAPARAIDAIAAGIPCTVVVTADRADVAFQRGLALVAAAGREALGVRLDAPGADAQATVLHALVRGAVPVLQAGGEFDGRSCQALVVLCGEPGVLSATGGQARIGVPVGPLEAPDRRTMWSQLLPELAGEAPRLAAEHATEPVLAAAVADDVRAVAALSSRDPGVADVSEALRVRSRGALPVGVTLYTPTARWHDLVVREHAREQLRAAAGRLRERSRVLDDWGFARGRPGARGVRVMLAGPPGTGKTLTAEVLATELDSDLMVVDLSRILSKWIGETEQRLAEAFDAAERGGAVLLFDEADALFGKRTEISDSHDRYANLETAYLLQRVERHDGLVVLATNLRQNVDEAFTRRLEFVVELDVPEAVEREALWRAHLPAGAPVEPDLDLAELAERYELVGGLIRNAATAAGFLAAADGSPIGREHLLVALRREYDKHGRAFPGRTPNHTQTIAEEALWP